MADGELPDTCRAGTPQLGTVVRYCESHIHRLCIAGGDPQQRP